MAMNDMRTTPMPAVIVEDNPVELQIMVAGLERCGFEVQAFACAEEALALCRRQMPRLLIVDWNLPGMDGITFCSRIRNAEQGPAVVILMVSSYSTHAEMEAALAAGVDSFMIKPVSASTLAVWLANTRRKLVEVRELEARNREINAYKEEMESLTAQLEESISRANQLAVGAERAYIELNQIFKTVAGGIVLMDMDYNLLRYNEAFLEMVASENGNSPQECFEYFHGQLSTGHDSPLSRIKRGEQRVETEIRRVIENGSEVYYNVTATPYMGPGGDLFGIVEHFMDVTERVRAQQALAESERRYKELSLVDELTGLYNKRHFNQMLQLEIDRASRYGHPLALLLMDIDNFKQHNDSYGHAEGDKVLEGLGRVVADGVRATDVACRYGGEEFGVILAETSGEKATVVAERIRASFAALEFFPRPGERVCKTLSIGVAQFVKGEKKIEFIERADNNLYQAKKGGKNRWVFG